MQYFLESGLIKSNADRAIVFKVLRGKRISEQEALHLYTKTETGLLSLMADHVKRKLNTDKVFFIRNIHLEPTNLCVYNCKFCSFVCKSKENSRNYTLQEIKKIAEQIEKDINEIHITGGTHPDSSIDQYKKILTTFRSIRPKIHIKAFSAVELFYIFKKDRIDFSKGLKILIKAGLNSIPGGGAEIFDENIRKEICPEKVTSEAWLEIHKTAHQCGIFSNATMLYGHIENYQHRTGHMSRLRELQDETGGFNAFIPLKFRNKHNSLSYLEEVPLLEDLRNYAVARIFLDNIPHLKAYWPMLGKKQAQLALSFGVDDIDGTINNSTTIYTTAGMNKNENTLSVADLKKMITQSGYIPVERYSDYSAVEN